MGSCALVTTFSFGAIIVGTVAARRNVGPSRGRVCVGMATRWGTSESRWPPRSDGARYASSDSSCQRGVNGDSRLTPPIVRLSSVWASAEAVEKPPKNRQNDSPLTCRRCGLGVGLFAWLIPRTNPPCKIGLCALATKFFSRSLFVTTGAARGIGGSPRWRECVGMTTRRRISEGPT
jgi:hypothetical protein